MKFFNKFHHKEIEISLQFVSIICSFIIPLLVLGPFLPDLIISLSSLWFLYYSWKYKLIKVYQNVFFYFFIAFWVILILSSLLSDQVFYSLKSSLFYLRIGIFALLISYLIDQNKKIIDYFYFMFVLTFSVLIIDGYIQFFTGTNLLGYEAGGKRISSFFHDEYILGSYLVRLLPLCTALFFARNNKKKWEFYFFPIFFISVSILIFFAGERASLFFLFLFLVFLLIFLSKFKFFSISIFFVIILISFLLASNTSRIKDRYFNDVIESYNLKNSNIFFFTPEHDRLFKTGFKIFLNKPILGHGPKSFSFKCREWIDSSYKYACSQHPHNFYIQLLAETGIVGTLFLIGVFSFLVFLFFRRTFEYFSSKNFSLSDYQICLFAGLLITVWPLTTNGSFFTNNLMILYGLQIGFFGKKI
jgi:O-antigen ligase